MARTGDTSTDRTPLAPATIELVYTWTSTIFRAGVIDQVIHRSPCQQIRLPKSGATRWCHFPLVKDKRNRPPTIPLPQVVIDALVHHFQT